MKHLMPKKVTHIQAEDEEEERTCLEEDISEEGEEGILSTEFNPMIKGFTRETCNASTVKGMAYEGRL